MARFRDHVVWEVGRGLFTQMRHQSSALSHASTEIIQLQRPKCPFRNSPESGPPQASGIAKKSQAHRWHYATDSRNQRIKPRYPTAAGVANSSRDREARSGFSPQGTETPQNERKAVCLERYNPHYMNGKGSRQTLSNHMRTLNE